MNKKFIFLGLFIFSNAIASDFIWPTHDDIKAEVNSLIELGQKQKDEASVIQKLKKSLLQNNEYIQITNENSPNIYKLIDQVSKTIGVDIPSTVYLNNANSLNCIPFLFKNLKGDISLVVGEKFLLELTIHEIEAILIFEFMHVKDKLLDKIFGKSFENEFIPSALVGAWIGVLISLALIAVDSKKCSTTAIAAAIDIPVMALLSKLLLNRYLKNYSEIQAVLKELERKADLNIGVSPDFISALKKIIVMIVQEDFKKNVSVPMFYCLNGIMVANLDVQIEYKKISFLKLRP